MDPLHHFHLTLKHLSLDGFTAIGMIASLSSAPVVSLKHLPFHPLHHFLPCHLTLTHLSRRRSVKEIVGGRESV